MQPLSFASFTNLMSADGSRKSRRLLQPLALLCVLLTLFTPGAVALASPEYDASQAASTPLRPFVYAAISSNSAYDITLSDGVNKDRRIARIKVDSVFFGNVSARLSANGTNTAFRVTGDRLGGSSLYSVDVKSGKYVPVASAPNASESIGAYAWSPAGNTLAFVRSNPAPDPADVDDAFGTIYIYSVGFKAVHLASSNGSDHLIGFSGDGLGLYASRLESTPSGTLQNLVYLPLSGGDARVLVRSQPDLRYTHFAVWASQGAPAKVAFLAEGNFALATSKLSDTASGPVGPVMRGAAPAGKLAGPGSVGLVVSDLMGTWPTLVRHDAQAYPVVAWKPDGSGLIAGGTRTGTSWAIDMAGNHHALNASLYNMDPITWSADNSQVVVADMPNTRLLSLAYASGDVAATRYVGATPKAGAAVLKLAVPYIHQVRDTADNGNGNWACGPTSVAMALAYFGRIEPWTTQTAVDRMAGPDPKSAPPTAPASPTDTPTPHAVTAADFAPYITNKYTAFGHTYDSVSRDPSGNLLAGLYGTIAPSGYASWPAMQSVLGWHGLSSQWVSDSWDGIVGALKRGHPVLLGNMLTSEGHIILVVGYTADGNLIVNDPYGNRLAPGYGGNDGYGILYPWKIVTPRRALEVIGTVPPPTPTPTKTPTVTRTATTTPTQATTHTPTASVTSTAIDAETPAIAVTAATLTPIAP